AAAAGRARGWRTRLRRQGRRGGGSDARHSNGHAGPALPGGGRRPGGGAATVLEGASGRGRSEETLGKKRRRGGRGQPLADEDRLGCLRLLVHVSLSGVVPEHHFLVRDGLDVLREERDLAAAARRVDYEVRHGEPRRPAPQRLDDLEPLLDRGAEMLRPRD